MSGTVIAGVSWTFLLEGLRVVLPPEILDWRLVIYPLLLIIVMLLRPKGLFGGREFGFLLPREPRGPEVRGQGSEDGAE
jgi:branched-chain amino acid transport system permease protein